MTRRCVVDSSVAAKWFLPEDDSDAALRLIEEPYQLLAPDQIFAEVANVLWKRVEGKTGASRRLRPVEALGILDKLFEVPIESWDSRLLTRPALELACRFGCAAYDALYLALAVQEEVVLVTADQRFAQRFLTGPLSSSVVWVGDLPLAD